VGTSENALIPVRRETSANALLRVWIPGIDDVVIEPQKAAVAGRPDALGVGRNIDGLGLFAIGVYMDESAQQLSEQGYSSGGGVRAEEKASFAAGYREAYEESAARLEKVEPPAKLHKIAPVKTGAHFMGGIHRPDEGG
jgi:hypothetical protein